MTAVLVACGSSSGSSASPSTVARPILAIQMSTSVNADGSAKAATMTFDSAKDSQIIALLTLANLDAGTKLSFTR